MRRRKPLTGLTFGFTAFIGQVAFGAWSTGPARAETYFNASSILAMCNAEGNGSSATGKRNICAFYLVGVSDALVTASLYVRPAAPIQSPLYWPDTISIDALPAAMRAYSKVHPARLGDSAAKIAAEAFLARNGCPKDGPAAGTKADVVFFSAGDLLQQCKDTNALSGLYCLHYVVGVSDLYAELASGGVRSATTPFAEQICYPRAMPDDQPKHAFVAYMTAHPAARKANAALTAARALHEAFPCR